MAKMFYTLEEAKSALGKSEDEIKQFARDHGGDVQVDQAPEGGARFWFRLKAA